MADKYFNREEAEQLIPILGDYLEQAIDRKKSIDNLDQDLAQSAARIMILGGSLPPTAELARKRTQREQLLAQLQKTVEAIQEVGCVVKDLEMGLIDFPSLLNGKEVYLCWKLGEKHIAYWHGMDEGFAGRKPLDESGSDAQSDESIQ